MRSKKKKRVLREAPARSFAVSYAAIVVCYVVTRDAVCARGVSGRAQSVAAKSGRNSGSFNYCSVFLEWRAEPFSDAIGVRL